MSDFLPLPVTCKCGRVLEPVKITNPVTGEARIYEARVPCEYCEMEAELAFERRRHERRLAAKNPPPPKPDSTGKHYFGFNPDD